jgi:hypothetical protein
MSTAIAVTHLGLGLMPMALTKAPAPLAGPRKLLHFQRNVD